GIRLALGASRLRIIRQLLTQSLLLDVAAGALGLIIAIWTTDLASGLRTTIGCALTLDVSLNSRVLIFNLAVSVLTALWFGLAPALKATRLDLVPALKAATNMSRRRRRPPPHSDRVVTQATPAVGLLAGAGRSRRTGGDLRALAQGVS